MGKQSVCNGQFLACSKKLEDLFQKHKAIPSNCLGTCNAACEGAVTALADAASNSVCCLSKFNSSSVQERVRLVLDDVDSCLDRVLQVSKQIKSPETCAIKNKVDMTKETLKVRLRTSYTSSAVTSLLGYLRGNPCSGSAVTAAISTFKSRYASVTSDCNQGASSGDYLQVSSCAPKEAAVATLRFAGYTFPESVEQQQKFSKQFEMKANAKLNPGGGLANGSVVVTSLSKGSVVVNYEVKTTSAGGSAVSVASELNDATYAGIGQATSQVDPVSTSIPTVLSASQSGLGAMQSAPMVGCTLAGNANYDALATISDVTMCAPTSEDGGGLGGGAIAGIVVGCIAAV